MKIVRCLEEYCYSFIHNCFVSRRIRQISLPPRITSVVQPLGASLATYPLFFLKSVTRSFAANTIGVPILAFVSPDEVRRYPNQQVHTSWGCHWAMFNTFYISYYCRNVESSCRGWPDLWLYPKFERRPICFRVP